MAEINRDIERIKSELDNAVFTEGVEENVLEILWRWATRGTRANSYLDRIFDGLQVTRAGFFGDTTYYDALLDDFDRGDEVRRLRDGTERWQGVESKDETERRAEELAEREEVNRAADAEGKWVENVAEAYRLPSTPENLYLARLAVMRLSEIPSDQLTPEERALSELVSREGPEALLKRIHFSTEWERREQRKARMRAIAAPLFEIVLWITAERLAAFALEAVAARLFPIAAEAGGATALAVRGESALGSLARREAEASIGSLGRRGAAQVEGGAGAQGWVAREGYAYRIESINAQTGEVIAIGRNTRTGEVAQVRLNVDTGTGVATHRGETLTIARGRVEPRSGAVSREVAGVRSQKLETGGPGPGGDFASGAGRSDQRLLAGSTADLSGASLRMGGSSASPPGTTSSNVVVSEVASWAEARAAYAQAIERSPHIEVGIFQHPVTKKFTVRSGTGLAVKIPQGWTSLTHYHPNAENVLTFRLPSRNDVTQTYLAAIRSNRPMTEMVEWPLPGGGRGRTTWTVDPDSSTIRIIFDPRAKRPNLELPLTEFERYWHERTVFAKPGTPLHQDLTEDLLHEVRSRR